MGNETKGKAVKRIVSVILVLLGTAGIVCFMMPFISYGILMIWNGMGLALGILFVLMGIFLTPLFAFFRKVWKTKAGKVICGAAAGALGAGLILVIVISGLMIHAAGRGPEKNATLVVLGCRVIGEQPSLMLEERLEAAYVYLSANPDSAAVLSGGQGGGEDISEAECMYRYLTGRGIASERLYLEDRSTSTRENLAFSGEIIKKKNLNKDIAIVTNEFHEYRAFMVAEALGMKPAAVPGKTIWKLFPTYYLRELFGVVYEWIL